MKKLSSHKLFGLTATLKLLLDADCQQEVKANMQAILQQKDYNQLAKIQLKIAKFYGTGAPKRVKLLIDWVDMLACGRAQLDVTPTHYVFTQRLGHTGTQTVAICKNELGAYGPQVELVLEGAA